MLKGMRRGFGRQNVAKERLGVSRPFDKIKKKQCKPHEMIEESIISRGLQSSK